MSPSVVNQERITASGRYLDSVRKVVSRDAKTVGDDLKKIFGKIPKTDGLNGIPTFYADPERQSETGLNRERELLRSKNNAMLEYITKAKVKKITPQTIEHVMDMMSDLSTTVIGMLNNNEIGFLNSQEGNVSQAEKVIRDIHDEVYVCDMQVLSLLAEYCERKRSDYDLVVSALVRFLRTKEFLLINNTANNLSENQRVKYREGKLDGEDLFLYSMVDATYCNCLRYLFRIVQDYKDKIYVPSKMSAFHESLPKQIVMKGPEFEFIIDEDVNQLNDLISAITGFMHFAHKYTDKELNAALTAYVARESRRLPQADIEMAKKILRINAKAKHVNLLDLLKDDGVYLEPCKAFLRNLSMAIEDLGIVGGTSCNVNRAIVSIPKLYKMCGEEEFKKMVKLCFDDLAKLASDKAKGVADKNHPFLWMYSEELGLVNQVLCFLLEGKNIPQGHVINPDLYYYLSAILYFAAGDKQTSLKFAEKSHMAESVWLQGYLHDESGDKLKALDKYEESLLLGCNTATYYIEDLIAEIEREEDVEWWNTPRPPKENAAKSNKKSKGKQFRKPKEEEKKTVVEGSGEKINEEVRVVAQDKNEPGKKADDNLGGCLAVDSEDSQSSDTSTESGFQKVTTKVPVMHNMTFGRMLRSINSDIKGGEYEKTRKRLCTLAERTSGVIHQARIAQVNFFRMYLMVQDEQFLDDFLSGKIKRIALHLENADLHSTPKYYILSEGERNGTISKADAIRRLQRTIGKEIIRQAPDWQVLLHSQNRSDDYLANRNTWLHDPAAVVDYLIEKEKSDNNIISNPLASASGSLLSEVSHVHDKLNPFNLSEKDKDSLKEVWYKAADRLNLERKLVRTGRGEHKVLNSLERLNRQFGLEDRDRLTELPRDACAETSYTHIGPPIVISDKRASPPMSRAPSAANSAVK